jgi:hypothetical protein
VSASTVLFALPTLISIDVLASRMPVAESIQFLPGWSSMAWAVSRLLLTTPIIAP